MHLERIAIELKAWPYNHPHGFVARPKRDPNGTINLLTWECGIPALPFIKTPFTDNLLKVTLQFDEHYPMRAPCCEVEPALDLHPNIIAGKLNVELSFGAWQPTNTICKLLLDIEVLVHLLAAERFPFVQTETAAGAAVGQNMVAKYKRVRSKKSVSSTRIQNSATAAEDARSNTRGTSAPMSIAASKYERFRTLTDETRRTAVNCIDFTGVFDDIPLMNEDIKRALVELGITAVTELQKFVLLRVISESSNVSIRGNIGCGKSTAMAIAVAHMVESSVQKTQALYLCYTYESAMSMKMLIDKITKYMDITTEVVTHGKMPTNPGSSHILIGTPVSISTMVVANRIDRNFIKAICVDDADVVSNLVIVKEATQLLSDGRIMMCSSNKYQILRNIVTHNFESPYCDLLSVNMRHFYSVTPPSLRDKTDALKECLGKFIGIQTIVFCWKRNVAQMVVKALRSNSTLSVALMTKECDFDHRDRTLKMFLENKVQMLVSTNLLSRGIDNKNIGLIVNFDIPMDNGMFDLKVYRERAGRTARFTHGGTVLTFVTNESADLLKSALQTKLNIFAGEIC